MRKLIRNSHLNRFYIFFFVASILSTAVAYTVLFKTQNEINTLIKSALSADLAQIKRDIVIDFEHYDESIKSLRSAIYVSGTEKIDYSTIDGFFNSIEFKKDLPGALGIGFIRWVKKEDTETFLKQHDADKNAPSLKIRELSPNSSDRFVIQFVLPFDANKQAIGLDIASEDNRKTAALKAFNNNRTQLTEPITLVQEEGKTGWGFLLLTPVYQNQTLKAKPVGWSYSPLVVSDVLSNLNLTNVSLSLFDASFDQEKPFYTNTDDVNQKEDPQLTDKRLATEFNLFGRSWRAEISPTQAFIDSLNLPNKKTNTLISFLLTMMALNLLYFIIEITIQRRILFTEFNKLKAIINSVNTGLIVLDKDFKIIRYNLKALALLDKNLKKGELINNYIGKFEDTSSFAIFNRIQNELIDYKGFFKSPTNPDTSLSISLSPVLYKDAFYGLIMNFHEIEEDTYHNDCDLLAFPSLIFDQNLNIQSSNISYQEIKTEVNLDSITDKIKNEIKISGFSEFQFQENEFTIYVGKRKNYYSVALIKTPQHSNKVLEESHRTPEQIPPLSSQNLAQQLAGNACVIKAEDYKQALNRFSNSENLYKEAFLSFLTELEKAMQTLSIDEGKQTSTLQSLHSLKGSFATFGFTKLSEDAFELEERIKRSETQEIANTMTLFIDHCAAIITNSQNILKQTDTDTFAQVNYTEVNNTLLNLLKAVEQSSLESIDIFSSISSSLEKIDKTNASKLVAAMRNLDFIEAKNIINIFLSLDSNPK